MTDTRTNWTVSSSLTDVQQIASDQLDYLRENPDVTAQVSAHVGRHPYIRWNGDLEAYEIAEISDIGNLEVTACPKGDLLNLVAENPVELYPMDKATYSPPSPGRDRVWHSVDAMDSNVIHTNRADYSTEEDELDNGENND